MTYLALTILIIVAAYAVVGIRLGHLPTRTDLNALLRRTTSNTPNPTTGPPPGRHGHEYTHHPDTPDVLHAPDRPCQTPGGRVALHPNNPYINCPRCHHLTHTR